MNLVYTPQEIFAIAIVLAGVEVVKQNLNINKKWFRFLPLPFAAIIGACIIIDTGGGWPGLGVFIAREVQMMLKIAFSAMGLFDLVLKKKKE
jgi:hypothetical protein